MSERTDRQLGGLTGPVGFIGLGNMGRPMAGHLLDGGVPLVVHDLRPAAGRPLLERGAVWADTPAELARRVRTLITIVPSSREVEALAEALLPVLGSGHLWIDMTSADPSSTRAVAARVGATGAAMLDAPVSGGVGGAERATLAIMVGGAEADLARAQPLLERMGKRVFHVGGIGTGHAMKLVNNATSAACLTATAEAVAVAIRSGIDPARAVEVIAASTGRSDAVERKFPQFILPGGFNSGFALALMDKDLTAFVKLAGEVGCAPAVTGTVQRLFRAAMAGELATADTTAIVTTLGYPASRGATA